jgi:hypothetical protein
MRMNTPLLPAHFAETGPNITEVNETQEYDTSAIQGQSRAENPVRNSVQNRPWPSPSSQALGGLALDAPV